MSLLRYAVVASSAAALLTVSLVGSAAASPALRAADRISLSADVERLAIRPCLPESMRLGITNHGPQGRFVDVSITAQTPLQSSKPAVTTYVPAAGTAYVNLRISALVDAVAGTYEVRFATGRTEQLAVPATVVTSPDTRCLPRETMTATATSAQASPDYGPRYAIDGTDTTVWHTRYSPVSDVLPQSITLDLDGTHDVADLVYQPRTSGSMNGTITAYVVYASPDGQTFTKVAEGTWAADRTRKTANVGAANVRHLRLEAIQGHGGYASAAEIVLFGRTA